MLVVMTWKSGAYVVGTNNHSNVFCTAKKHSRNLTIWKMPFHFYIELNASPRWFYVKNCQNRAVYVRDVFCIHHEYKV
uniref:Uncharacterized protein n=1 Tax=Pararge aegeria TaxID=116150 RepID=S4PXF4_9NEOP